MAKFLYLQDFQIIGKNSIHYIGNYFDDCMLMLDEILSIAKKENVDSILDGGDLLDAPLPSYKILDEIADRVEEANINIYSLFGNHAERYHSMEHSQYTGLMHLIKRSKNFVHMNDNKLNDILRTKNYCIKGFEYSHNIEEEIKENGIKLGQDFQWKIAIVHAFICPKPFLKDVCHVVCDDIQTNADIVLVAHYHAQWEKKIGNTLFKDIGCLGRTSITERNIEPTILLIDTDKREIKKIKLKSAKLGSEIFDLSKVNKIKTDDENMDKFIKSIESTEFQASNVIDNIKFISKEKNIEPEVTNLLLDKIKEIGNE